MVTKSMDPQLYDLKRISARYKDYKDFIPVYYLAAIIP